MKVGLEKLENHEGVAVKALLDSGATGLFMDTTFAREKGFKMERMKNPLLVKNVDGTVNVGGAITHQVECNMFFKGHVERVRMDVCNLGKTEVILGMPWLAAHNPEIDWEKGEVKMTRCPPLCGKKKQEEKKKEVKKLEKDEDEETLRKLVPKRFWRWKKVFGKKESERMPVRKTWDHAIELKEGFTPRKERCTHYRGKKERKYRHSWKTNYGKGISGPPNRRKHRQYTLWQKRTVKGGWYKTTDI